MSENEVKGSLIRDDQRKSHHMEWTSGKCVIELFLYFSAALGGPRVGSGRGWAGWIRTYG